MRGKLSRLRCRAVIDEINTYLFALFLILLNVNDYGHEHINQRVNS